MNITVQKVFDFCGRVSVPLDAQNLNRQHLVIFMWSLFPIVSVTLSVQFFIKWINNMDYFPLKERSPILTIALMFSLMTTINIYPSLVIASYYSFDYDYAQSLFKTYTCLFYASRGMTYLIYVIRSLRIVYAYRLKEVMRLPKHPVFRLFKQEILFILLLILVFAVKYAIVWTAGNWKAAYATSVTKCGDTEEALSQINTLLYIRKLVELVPWQLILTVCLWLQRKVDPQFGIIRELFFVLALNVVFSAADLTSSASGQRFGLKCYGNYPIQQIAFMGHNILLFVVSIMFPVSKIRHFHVLLPIQQPYDLDNSLKNFLLDPGCFTVFYKFLKSVDNKEADAIPYTEYMLLWSKIIRSKDQEDNDETEIRELIQKLETADLDSRAITTLNASITVLKDAHSQDQIQDALNQFNCAIEILSDEILQHLTIVYKNTFQKTKAYLKLKQIMHNNDRININMLMLNMILRENID